MRVSAHVGRGPSWHAALFYTRPVMRLAKVLAVLVLLLGLGYGAYVLGRTLSPEPPLAGTELKTPVPVGDVTLTNAAGEHVPLSSFAGKHLLVFFGYTHCPDVCPLTMARLAKVYRDLGEPEDLAVLMITVDPANDTPESVQRYVSGFHPDFIGLGGTNPEVAAAAKRFYIGVQEVPGEIAHTDAVILVDPQSRMRAVYGQPSLGALQADLERLL